MNNNLAKLKEKKCFLLDMDGTIYLGNNLINGAREFLEILKNKNIKYLFLTNNSSKNKDKYVEKLYNLGVLVDRENIFTSGEATTVYLKKIKKNAKIFLLGTKDLEDEFKREGFELVKERNKEIDFVVLGFDTTLTYEKLWIACEYIAEGVTYIATHPDFNCPLEGEKFMPDAGAMIAFIKASTGREPLVVGKPNVHIINAIIEKYDLEKEDLVMVGDRLYTDIRTGLDNNISSVLVMSGETSETMLKDSVYKPDYIFSSVKELGEKLR
ncbi:MAG: HAD family hydrolase [Fusobacteriales bacterium]|nr:MAG: HAD family hydrolase [Fusobacteriales bacterium]